MATLYLLQFGSFEQLGLLYIASVCKKSGHSVYLSMIDKSVEKLIRSIRATRADLVGISCTTGFHRDALSIAKLIKKNMSTKIILGGIHPTVCPEIIKDPSVDFVCRGEGEYPLKELLDLIEIGATQFKVDNVLTKQMCDQGDMRIRPAIEDLDELPFPERSLYYENKTFRGLSTRTFITGRGCIFNCSYCSNFYLYGLLRGKRYRVRSINNVIEELVYVKKRWGLKSVLFSDDIFGLDRTWLLEFLDVYVQKVNVPFACHLRPGSFDREIVKSLKKSGCWYISFGIESGNLAIRKNLMGRNIADEQIIESAWMIKRAGILLETTNIVGCPGEDIKDVFDTVRLNQRIKPNFVSVSIFQPYPGTELARSSLEKGLLKEDDIKRINRTYYESSILKQPDIHLIINLHKFFILIVKFPLLEIMVKFLIHLEPNRIFQWIFILSHGFRSIRLYRAWENIRVINVALYWLDIFNRERDFGNKFDIADETHIEYNRLSSV